ncbi:MAG TPA: EamA family transporter [Humisphaera sp.]|nr:EamA family transporter [Humisphaera sp.]
MSKLEIEYNTPAPAGAANIQRTAALALALATVFWGCGFTWAKAGADAIHRITGLPQGSGFGPIFLLGWRFGFGGAIWMILFPAARRGWSFKSSARAMLLGALCAGGLIVQHMGLDLTDESVSAFLTSLTILFVPLLVTLIARRPPRAVLWVGVALATIGVWLMTGASPSGFHLGEFLGLLCSFCFALYILAVNAILPKESSWRMTGGQFITVSVICFAVSATIAGRAMRPAIVIRLFSEPAVFVNLVLLAIFTTVMAFGLLTHFQPRLDPTRAALIYLLEPVIAAIYAAMAVGRTFRPLAIIGAILILAANAFVEFVLSRKKSRIK